VISNAGGIFWGLVFAAGGAVFFYILLTDRTHWWAAFPAFTLFGLAASAFLPASLDAYGGLVFFLGISLGFWWVYFTNTEQWWAIIPGGVLLTLGVVSALDNLLEGSAGGGIFFLGLGLTFVLVAILPGGGGRSWALIPGTILLIFGAILGTPFFGLAEYFWPVVLILLGGYFVLRFFLSRPSA
ncbi:MAG TPA: hypothetical protein VNJ09_10175, partial [Chthonomonadales bacterium]|nr:hypothetical protein [Chthonomonadales bacterium]